MEDAKYLKGCEVPAASPGQREVVGKRRAAKAGCSLGPGGPRAVWKRPTPAGLPTLALVHCRYVVGKRAGKARDQPTLLPAADRAGAGAQHSRQPRSSPSSPGHPPGPFSIQDAGSCFPPRGLDTWRPVPHLHCPTFPIRTPLPLFRPRSFWHPTCHHLWACPSPARLSPVNSKMKPCSELCPRQAVKCTQHPLAGGLSGFLLPTSSSDGIGG